MKTTDFNRPITSKMLNESLARQFGSKVNLEKYTMEQLEDFRNKIRTKLSQQQTTGGFNETVESSNYKRDTLILDVLNKHLEERASANLAEGVDPKQAGVVQAAVDMQNKVKNMLEDLGSMMTKSMVALSDDIKDNMGADSAMQFSQIVTPALEQAMEFLQGTREALEQGVGVLTGEQVPATIGQEPEVGMDDMGAESPEFDNDLEAEPEFGGDEFDASDAAAGGPEVAGREKRESINFRKPTLAESNRLMYKLAK